MKTEKTPGREAAELDPNLMAMLIEQVQVNTQTLVEQMDSNIGRLLEQFGKDATQDAETQELWTMVKTLEGKITAPPTGIAYAAKAPSYKRVLRRGESIQDVTVRGQLNPLVKTAGKKFAEKYEENFKHDNCDKLPEELLKGIEGASAAIRAVTAAYIDRSGLDQTTRYLLTRKHLLAGELYRVQKEGSPALHETIAVMEAINQGLVGLLHDDKGEGFYDYLVAEHGQKRGWSDELKTTVAKLLAERFEKQR